MHGQHTTLYLVYMVRNCYSGESNVPTMLEVGSAVEFGYPVQYGTIKRIEEDPISNKEIATIETVS